MENKDKPIVNVERIKAVWPCLELQNNSLNESKSCGTSKRNISKPEAARLFNKAKLSNEKSTRR